MCGAFHLHDRGHGADVRLDQDLLEDGKVEELSSPPFHSRSPEGAKQMSPGQRPGQGSAHKDL
jgi:hypothetical protein